MKKAHVEMSQKNHQKQSNTSCSIMIEKYFTQKAIELVSNKFDKHRYYIKLRKITKKCALDE